MGYAAEKQWQGNVNGKTVTAELTAYYPADDAMEGGFNDCKGNPLDVTVCTCAAPMKAITGSSEHHVEYGTLVKFSGTGTDIDGKIYRVTDCGGAIKVKNCGSCGGTTWCFDILMKDKATANSFGRRHGVTAQFGDVVDANGNLVPTGSSGTTGASNLSTTRTTTSFKTNPKTDWLLEPTDDERKYGINIYDGEQPLIKFSTYSAITEQGGAVGALKKYAEFLYYLLNSEVSTAQVNCIGMPWIRPGFNVWYDPIYSDAIYYCTNVQHQGDPTNGGSTVLTLVLGRSREAFINDSDRFGSFKANSDNVFISDMKDEYRVSKFGKCLDSAEAFEAVKNATVNYYGSPSFETMDATDSEFHKNMYVTNADSSPIPENINKDKVFSGAYTKEQIEVQLSNLYNSAPDVIKNRSSQLKKVVDEARKYMDKYNLLESHRSG